MIDKIKFKKYNSVGEIVTYLDANNLLVSMNLSENIYNAGQAGTEFAILQESMFDGYRILPIWDMVNMSSKIDNTWFTWYATQKEHLPPDMFDQRTRKPYEAPYGFIELSNISTLFRIDNKLMRLFDSIPRSPLHEFLEDYHAGNLRKIRGHLQIDATEWPVTLALGMSDSTRVGFFTVSKIFSLLKQQNKGFATYFDQSENIKSNLLRPELRQSKGIITTFGRALQKLAREGHNRPWNHNIQCSFEDILLFNGSDGFRFEMWDASEIPYAYHWESYAEESGTLGRSCMRSQEDQHKVMFYKHLGNNIKILVLLNQDDLILGRALVWQNCFNRKRKHKFKVMDRVYTTQNRYEVLFHRYAVDNDIIRKKLNSYTNNTLIQPNGKGGIGACFIKVPKKMQNILQMQAENQVNRHHPVHEIKDTDRVYLPWLDTFKFYDHIAGAFTTHKILGGRFKCQSTTGTMYTEHSYDHQRSYDLRAIMNSKEEINA